MRGLRVADAVVATRLLGLLSEQTLSIPAEAPLVHTSAVVTADFSPGGGEVVTAAADGRVRIWSWTEPSQPPPRLFDRVFFSPAAAFVPGTGRIPVADHAGVSLWSEDGELLSEQAASLDGMLRWTVTRDGRRAMLVSSLSDPQMWDPRGPALIRRIDLGDPAGRGAPMSADGRYVLRSMERPGEKGWHIGAWDLDTGRRGWHVKLPFMVPDHAMYSGTFSDDNALVVVNRWGGQLLVWRLRPRGED